MFQVTRTQFPLVPAEAITVHKAQGQTFQHVVFHPPLDNRGVTRALYYVACSRATNAHGLHIAGQFRPPAINENGRVALELRRLREDAPIVFTLKSWSDFPENRPKVIFHNVEGLRRHSASTFADPAFSGADVVLLVETWCRREHVFDVEGRAVLARIDAQDHRNDRQAVGGSGSMVLVNDAIKDQCTQVQQHHWSSPGWRIEMITLQIANVSVVLAYFSPRVTRQAILTYLRRVIQSLPPGPLLLTGDFNVDLKRPGESRFLTEQLNAFGLRSLLEPEASTTNLNTQIDLIYTNIPEATAAVYESATSYHKPLMFNL